MPSRASSTGPIPAISRPRKRTIPTVGRSRPVTTLTSVVLPAPLGPTIEMNSPSLTLKEMSFKALNAPNDLETLMVSNRGSAMATPVRAGCISSPSTALASEKLDGAGQALRHEDHQKHQHATHHEAPILGDRHHKILQHHEHQSANRRASKAAAAAEHGHEHQISRMGPVSQLGVGQSGGDSQDGAADPTIDGRDHEGRQPH